MFCRNCGNELSAGVKFCGRCGKPVQNEVVRNTMDMETLCQRIEDEINKGKEQENKFVEDRNNLELEISKMESAKEELISEIYIMEKELDVLAHTKVPVQIECKNAGEKIKYCPNCGFHVDGAVFCGNCGEKVNERG